MDKIAIFCENYGTVNTTLYLAQHYQHNSPVTIIIPAYPNLFKLFQAFNEKVFGNTLALIYLEPYLSLTAIAGGIKKLVYSLPELIGRRKHIRSIFEKKLAHMKDYDVYFASRHNDGSLLYLLRRLHENNRLIYINSFPPTRLQSKPYMPFKLRDLINLLTVKITYAHDMVMVKFPFTHGYTYIPDKFINKEVDRTISWEEREEMLADFDISPFRIFDIGDYDVLYYSSALTNDYIADFDLLDRELTAIFRQIVKYVPEERIAVKHHPAHGYDKKAIKVGTELDSSIPAEYLYSNSVKMYLGFWSMSITNVENGLAVSLKDLITLKSEKIRKQLGDYLLAHSKSEILFPKSLEELEKILIQIKNE